MDRTQLPPCPKRIERGLPLLLAGLVAFGCGPAPVDSTARSPNLSGPRVVATYSILGDWVRQVGGERVQLTVLVGPGADAHTYEPTPRDVVAIAESEIVFENGLGFETWLDKLVASSGSNARRCVVGRVVQPRAIAANEIDPHVWQSPGNAVLMVEAIAEELASADPAHADQYRRRADEYVRSLESLEAEVREQTRTLPPERRKLATTHDTFGYFADEYGFEVLSVLGSVTSEAADPSAGEVAATIARIRELRVPAIFSENILNPRLTATGRRAVRPSRRCLYGWRAGSESRWSDRMERARARCSRRLPGCWFRSREQFVCLGIVSATVTIGRRTFLSGPISTGGSR